MFALSMGYLNPISASAVTTNEGYPSTESVGETMGYDEPKIRVVPGSSYRLKFATMCNDFLEIIEADHPCSDPLKSKPSGGQVHFIRRQFCSRPRILKPQTPSHPTNHPA